MELYFKDLSYETKYKFLEWYMTIYISSTTSILNLVKQIFDNGYYDGSHLSDYEKQKLKDLKIWKEPRKFGRAWDDYKEGCVYGFLLLITNDEHDDYKYHITNEYGGNEDFYKNFEEIKDLKELQ